MQGRLLIAWYRDASEPHLKQHNGKTVLFILATSVECHCTTLVRTGIGHSLIHGL